ncbi:cytochrome c oxidase assembly protein [Aliidiomarina minuta]|uniref:Cytochrome c oxidase assembly protein CtaG n=1 Tax=Aliidiomarina minuta TaxID=880057 RepID=A0A432W9R2_9GAMM|nr:cytochrome c oxidase assembly protein [Aliidiomarina minuta]RUO26781.1 cytochrome c oxidase assembly protein [Aliidiomarina minuta]
MREQQQQKPDNSRVITRLLASVVLMFAFGFALVPLYEKFCEVTGFNGRTTNTAAAASDGSVIDTSRLVTVEFHTRVNRGLPWEFESEMRRIQLHPGETKVVNFTAKNRTGRDMTGQALPSVSPGEAAPYLLKTECFCFQNQPLAAGDTAVMPMQFYIDPDIPNHIRTFTLSYMMYDMTEAAAKGRVVVDTSE